jgi:serine/threonine protein kinase
MAKLNKSLLDTAPGDSRQVTGEVSTIIAGRYRATQKLGRGGMASVYRAIDIETEQTVAVKILRAAKPRLKGLKERFINEVRIASLVKHPNIVELLDWGETEGGRVFLVMEYLEGEELKRLLRRRHHLRWQEAAPILLQICSAIETAHRAHIVHRDLKPENVLLQQRDGFQHFVKVLDFGLAKALADVLEHKGLTKTGMVMGTPSILAPEQIEGGDIDARTDIYALGVIMYRMLCGTLPFRHPNIVKLMYMQLNRPPVPPRQVNPQAPIPPDAEAIVLKALAKKPDDRFSSMQELAEHIAQVAPI